MMPRKTCAGMAFLVLCAVLVAESAARAEAPVAEPAPAPADPAAPAAAPAPEKVPVTAKIVEGTVETRPAVGQPWVPVQVGHQLAEGADLRTGFRARCVLDMVDSLVQVEALSVVRLGELKREGGAIRTRLYLKQGNTQSIVEKENIESDFSIVTPSATLSVQGTFRVLAGNFQDTQSHFGLTDQGALGAQNGLGQFSLLGPGQNGSNQFMNPIFFQAAGLLPNVADQFGFELSELFAAFQGGAGFPFPPGLGGPTGPLNLGGQSGQSGFLPPPPPPPPSNGGGGGNGGGNGGNGYEGPG
ncbi:MAG: hypothetical protein WBD75_06690 [Phycisphaerae bacterium]